MEELKEFIRNERDGMAESHLEGWFDSEYKGTTKDACEGHLLSHDDGLEIERTEDELKRKLTDEEREYLIEEFHNVIIENIEFYDGLAIGWYDTRGDLNT